jgi:NAD(P)-dependent dehydrogenase (short-subunit alcohol dehydrogenase family)
LRHMCPVLLTAKCVLFCFTHDSKRTAPVVLALPWPLSTSIWMPHQIMPDTILISGANRGIGLALTRELLLRGHRVVAGCREPATATELQALSELSGSMLDIQSLDISKADSVQALASHIEAKYASLDVLINNAGVLTDRDKHSILDLDFEDLAVAWETNLVGTARVAKAVWPLLVKGNRPRVINMASGAGLIGPKRNSNFYAYSISKAALNMLTRLLEIEGRAQSICVVAVIPGRVQTRITAMKAPLTAEESAQSLAVMVEGLQMTDTGAVLDRHGKPCFEGTFTDGTGQVFHVGW